MSRFLRHVKPTQLTIPGILVSLIPFEWKGIQFDTSQSAIIILIEHSKLSLKIEVIIVNLPLGRYKY